MGKRSQVKRTVEAAGIFTPLSCGNSRRPMNLREWQRDLVLSWFFHTCIALQTSLNRRFLGLGMTAQEASVLMRCVEAGKTSPGNLAMLLGRDKGMVTRFVDHLEASRLVTREVNRRDRRYSVIAPTREGKRMARKVACVFDSIRKELFAGIVESEVCLLNGLLPRLRKNAVAIGSRNDMKAIRPRRRITTMNAGKVRVSTASEKQMAHATAMESPRGEEANAFVAQYVEPGGRVRTLTLEERSASPASVMRK